ncbi:SusD/RagB family nutrient-binding outer membrane lipoprotein [Rufibacter hautae]|uniref:SusD/RagB family nutrient-binding outer membrane lipoprotein n=1 Tax=Rufibacter hautae TaxID=2595005 RepID=A0A5B6T894_9BACT|nr:SusD/RagB family nutrient-binding outer membrane lipoprotein [Rufibacter hautae]KAA3436137.1 SusD/RagB family nutrient-binding outer membrane lipoprotein [Rufibacter hautae]
MKKLKYISAGVLAAFMLSFSSCDEFLDVNENPNSPTEAPIAQVLTNATVNTGFRNGSDLHRFTSLIMQQFSGQAGPTIQTREYQRYLIQPSDLNNLYNAFYATALPDIEYVINNSEGSPRYTGIGRILKAYTYSQAVDVWGDVPFTEALQGVANLSPKVDDDAAIYPELFKLIDQGIADIKTPAKASLLLPGANETIYRGDSLKWLKFGNTLKLRLFLKYSEKDPAFAKSQMDALIATGGPFMTSNADNFEMAFVDATASQNPIHQFEVSRLNYTFPNKYLVDFMNEKVDPRRASYFTDFPYGSGQYKGAAAGDPESTNYSRLHTYLRGALKGTITPRADGGINANAAYNNAYTGSAPIRMLTFAEYNFIRAEHALRFGGGLAEATPFYQAGIRASMTAAGVATAAQDAYILANPLLAVNPLQQIIQEKYIANYGVALEPWNDWRRTGYPAITPVSSTIAATDYIPRSLYYPEAETNSNTNFVQKPDMNVRVFWDTRQ